MTETPTPERLKKAGPNIGTIDIEHRGAGRNKKTEALKVFDAPLDRLFKSGRITDEQHAAGEKYRRHWYLAGLSARVTPEYDAIFAGQEKSGMPASERQAHYRQMYREARRALGFNPALIAETILLDEMDLAEAGRKLFGRKDPAQARASAIDTLGIVLDSLVTHYKL